MAEQSGNSEQLKPCHTGGDSIRITVVIVGKALTFGLTIVQTAAQICEEEEYD